MAKMVRRGMPAATLVLLLAASALVGWVPSSLPAQAAPAVPAAACSDITLQVAPGLNPPANSSLLTPAPDMPHGAFTVSLPLYPGAVAITPWPASHYFSFSADPYLQTAGAEHRSSDSTEAARAWYTSRLRACGWHSAGRWSSNATAFTNGLFFGSNTVPYLTLQMSFGSAPSGGAYIGYGVEWILYPPRPAGSYLHGPFRQLRIAPGRNRVQNGKVVQRAIHVTVSHRAAIHHLVSVINSLGGYHTVLPTCFGPQPGRNSPARLAFVRPDGSVAHVYEVGPSACFGLAVNGIHWLIDTGAVWKQIMALAGSKGRWGRTSDLSGDGNHLEAFG